MGREKTHSLWARKMYPYGEPEVEEDSRVKPLSNETSLDHLSRPSPSRQITVEAVKGKEDLEAKKKLVVAGFAPGMVKKPHVDALLNRGYNTIYNELERLFLKSTHEDGLTATETKQFAEYIKTLKMMASEEREQRKADRIEDMTHDELRELASAILEEREDEV